jgi:hypothetical protein
LGLLRPAEMQQLDSTSSITATSIAATTGITTSAFAITAATTTERRRLAAHGRKHQRVRSL